MQLMHPLQSRLRSQEPRLVVGAVDASTSFRSMFRDSMEFRSSLRLENFDPCHDLEISSASGVLSASTTARIWFGKMIENEILSLILPSSGFLCHTYSDSWKADSTSPSVSFGCIDGYVPKAAESSALAGHSQVECK